MPSARVIILSRSLGVYLGQFLGLGLWSKGESCDGQIKEACTFPSADEALRFMETWDCFLTLPDDMTFPLVEVDPTGYATREACVAAGADPW